MFMFKKENKNKLPLTQNEFVYDESFYDESLFQYILVQERKRSKRSGKPFMLMIIDIHKLFNNGHERVLVKKLFEALSSTTREIDIKGWYKNNYSIGIIFTEISELTGDIIREKIFLILSTALDKKIVEMIKITCHVFPEDQDSDKPDKTSFDSHLYPDVPREEPPGSTLRFKRSIDIAGSIFLILLFSPFFIFIPLLIKLTSPGTILFKQERIGKFGKKFAFLKFRTMHMNCDHTIHEQYVQNFIRNKQSKKEDEDDEGKHSSYKMKEDPRITAFGKFLRLSSLDEIPQFFNVLRGDMSLVGPRPPIAYELNKYETWHRQRILYTKPGITGIWQISGRSRVSFNEMVRMDIQYMRKWSLMLDIKILMKTPLAVLSFKGAY